MHQDMHNIMANYIFHIVVLITFLSPLHCDGKRVVFTLSPEKNTVNQLEMMQYDATPKDWIVDALYKNSYDKIGWSLAEFSFNPDVDEETLAYFAGYADGSLTKTRIDQHWNNTIGDYCQGPNLSNSCKKLYQFLEQNLNWMKEMIQSNPDDVYWKEVKKALLQVQGLVDGYENKGVGDISIRLKPFGFLLFQLNGDMEDLEVALQLDEPIHHKVLGSGSCSAFVKLIKDSNGKEDLLSAHDTWAPFNGMLRIMKRFNFPHHSEAYSGYPGSIFSGDDFYILSSGLVTMETTNGNNNADLWKYVTPETVMEWVRNLVANRLAKNGEDWCKIFQRYNSGTYNNQWMVIDYNEFASNSKSNVLYVLEQIPGEIIYSDVTDVLQKQTYWASYNIPYYQKIFNDSGMVPFVKKFGGWFTHDKNPRARIFARDHAKVTDMISLIKLMRYNDFKNDPISRCNCTPPYSAENTIAARSDLNDPKGVYPFAALQQRNHGATDVKATSSTLMRSMAMMAECGPTHDQQPIFQWSKSPYAKSSHLGHPDTFDFKPELIMWEK